MNGIVKSWAVLVVASALTTGLPARQILPPVALAAVLIALALIKSRVILAQYLELRQAPEFLGAITAGFVIWSIAALGLILAA